jgi:hypothetical protein
LSDLVRLRYTGEQAVTFQFPGVGHVPPQGEFGVPPEALLSFMRRADIEHAGECHQPPCRCGEEPGGAREHPGYGGPMTGVEHPADGTMSPAVGNEETATGGGKRGRPGKPGTGEGPDEAHG